MNDLLLGNFLNFPPRLGELVEASEMLSRELLEVFTAPDFVTTETEVASEYTEEELDDPTDSVLRWSIVFESINYYTYVDKMQHP